MEKNKLIPGGTVSSLSLSLPVLYLSVDTNAYSTHTLTHTHSHSRLLVSPEWFVHQFVSSALFAAGNLRHHFNRQGSASSPKHSATIGKPSMISGTVLPQAAAAGGFALGHRLDERSHRPTVCLSCCWPDSLVLLCS